MSTLIQRLLMLSYAVVKRSGVLSVSPIRAAFEASYRLYKRLIEARYVAVLQAYVRPGTIVVDVGANIGFFTHYFAQWTGKDGRVLAIEPESRNYERLRAYIEGHHLDGVVVPVHAAAAESNGHVNLAVDPLHPGGHVLAPQGVATPAVTVDDLVRSGAVSLIKIDVQGAELRVLQGATSTLETSHPALLVELDERALRAQGASVPQVVDFLWSRGYRGRFVSRDGLSPVLERGHLVEACLRQDYVDVLFLHETDPQPPSGAPRDSARHPRE